MQINSSIPATFPFHVARAYGASGTAQTPRVPAQPAGGVTASSRAAGVEAPADAQNVRLLSPAGKTLVAGVVPGRVDFSGDQPAPSGLQFYRHPADRNAAAVGVQLGRSLDVSG